MIGMRIFEANVLHWAIHLDKKSLDEDYCRERADELHVSWMEVNCRRQRNEHRGEDLTEDVMMLRRLEIYFSKRMKVIEEAKMKMIHAKMPGV